MGQWRLKTLLGYGGNGEVWRAVDQSGNEQALKLLKTISRKAYARFIDEIKVLAANSDIEGILPILDRSLPKYESRKTPYYTMPIAVPVDRTLMGRDIEAKVDAIIEVAQIVGRLHLRGITHRDIKPANILYYNGRHYLADFGLADFPGKEPVSKPSEEIGAKWTIAPEMRRESELADHKKADVYSLAKTLWILLTNKSRGFDGQYTVDSSIELRRFYRDSYTDPIDNLLARCTDIEPDRRLTVDEFIQALLDWKTLIKDFHLRNRRQWLSIQNKLFPASLPQRVVWYKLDDMRRVLQTVCSYDQVNHLLFPDGGGLDLNDVRLSHEPGCLELDFGRVDVVKPKRLLFESFDTDPEWNYFYIELENLPCAEVVDGDQHDESPNSEMFEVISELSPLAYYPFDVLHKPNNTNTEYYVTSFSRHVKRWLKGNMVIFCKRSTYNMNTGTYDGRHNAMSPDLFRAYIQRNIRRIEEMRMARNVEPILNRPVPPQEPKEHRVIEQPVFRCGWCGDIVAEDGSMLDEEVREYHIMVYEAFGGSLTTCNSCHAERVAEYAKEDRAT